MSSRLRAAMDELEAAHREQDRCHLAWLVAQTAHPAEIDPYVSEAYCIASHIAALAQTKYHDELCDAQAEYFHGGEMERLA